MEPKSRSCQATNFLRAFKEVPEVRSVLRSGWRVGLQVGLGRRSAIVGGRVWDGVGGGLGVRVGDGVGGGLGFEGGSEVGLELQVDLG